MGFGGEMHDGIDAGHQRVEQFGVADVTLDERVPWGICDRCQVLEVSGICHGVEHNDLGPLKPGVRIFQGAPNKVRADKTGTAGDEDSHDLVQLSFTSPHADGYQ